MRGVTKAISIVGGSDGGSDGKDEEGEGVGGTSAISRISRGRDGVPESVGKYSLEMNSRINIRWVNEEENKGVECSRTGSRWQVGLRKDGESFVVSEHGSFEDALGASKNLMLGGDTGSGVPTEFEEEVEEMLENIDTGSMETIEEVGEAFED
jgi:hypothetical protein